MTRVFENTIIRMIVLVLAVLGVGFGIDPILHLLNGIPVQSVGVGVSLAVGFAGFKMLDVGSTNVVAEATAIVEQRRWTPALIPGLIAFGTSLSELGFVIISTLKQQNEILAHSIINSDGFQLGCLFFLCVIVAKTQQWDARLLRKDLILLTLMSFFVVSATLNGFNRVHGILITVTALLSAWQFLKDAPDGIFEEDKEDNSEKARGSVFQLVTGFALLLLGTVWFFDAIVYSGSVFNIPAFVLGIIGAFITSAGEVFTSVPLVKSGKKGLFFAAIALAGSNAFDTSFLGISSAIRPFTIEPVFHNVAPAVVTMGLTGLVYYFSYRHSIPKWVGYVIVPAYFASFMLLGLK